MKCSGKYMKNIIVSFILSCTCIYAAAEQPQTLSLSRNQIEYQIEIENKLLTANDSITIKYSIKNLSPYSIWIVDADKCIYPVEFHEIVLDLGGYVDVRNEMVPKYKEIKSGKKYNATFVLNGKTVNNYLQKTKLDQSCSLPFNVNAYLSVFENNIITKMDMNYICVGEGQGVWLKDGDMRKYDDNVIKLVMSGLQFKYQYECGAK
jgi:hypothetical protein